ncbi:MULTISPECIES: hypothetical protein [Thermococcus]|jgi:hypothetical protein|uniref:Uncharacterized protein n=1 Tax=Thermococcus barossii TaxID=54077 RepID=A0A2Z2MK00_9EURY|nr:MULTISPECIES: hypothetical protein [Thermococcus]ASJ05055.1 hypothetical protein A3L01_06630 [Thermococcus barossii]NJE77344.1 hypothetical protein [Thermococcus sp. ES12]
MGNIVLKVPPTVDEKIAKLIAETIAHRLESLERINQLLKNSELTEDEAVELGRKAKAGRGEYLERKYSPRG